jgi:putative transposase
MHKHLRRLGRIWIDSPIYFVTTCTHDRRQILARDEVAKVLIDEWSAAHGRHGWAVGRYVIMPDHVHFFGRPERDGKGLSEFVGFWKSYTSRKINALGSPRSTPAATTLWQREFFDHILRSDESYSENGTTFETIPSAVVCAKRGQLAIPRRSRSHRSSVTPVVASVSPAKI